MACRSEGCMAFTELSQPRATDISSRGKSEHGSLKGSLYCFWWPQVLLGPLVTFSLGLTLFSFQICVCRNSLEKSLTHVARKLNPNDCILIWPPTKILFLSKVMFTGMTGWNSTHLCNMQFFPEPGCTWEYGSGDGGERNTLSVQVLSTQHHKLGHL